MALTTKPCAHCGRPLTYDDSEEAAGIRRGKQNLGLANESLRGASFDVICSDCNDSFTAWWQGLTDEQREAINLQAEDEAKRGIN